MHKGLVDLKEAVRARLSSSKPATEERGGGSAIPWIFNQVLQPLIFVLAFVVVVQIVHHRNNFEKLVEALRENEDPVAAKVTILNHQLQRLY